MTKVKNTHGETVYFQPNNVTYVDTLTLTIPRDSDWKTGTITEKSVCIHFINGDCVFAPIAALQDIVDAL